MSHIPLRKENDCLNCGAMVHGRYCHVCGQENVIPKETFWHMVTHFFYDITHFDSSFFHTVKHLLFKPGYLSSEYMKGRRARYLHPIRMYVFTSAIFFLLFFSVFKPVTVDYNLDRPVAAEGREEYIRSLEQKLASDTGSLALQARLVQARDTTKALTVRDTMFFDADSKIINITKEDYDSMEQYDSVQKALPKDQRDGWVKKRFVRKEIEINTRYRGKPDEALDKFINTLLHRLPYMLFISLPLFALILKLVYFRRKQFYYADHGVFTIHLYIFTFMVLMLVMILDKIDQLVAIDFNWLFLGILAGTYLYLYKAMRRFYQQRRAKTIAKFILVALLSLLMMIALFIIFFIFSSLTF